tara:strand:- start:150 stop:389 length:240 start_codon:yes stop_codon:yes gene_type:complete
MVYKVQVVSEEEAKKYNQWQNDLDRVCNRIKLYICWSICIFLTVYMIVTIIMTIIHFQEMGDYDYDSDYLLNDNSSSSH